MTRADIKTCELSTDGLCKEHCGECATRGACAGKLAAVGRYDLARWRPHGGNPADQHLHPWIITELLQVIGEDPTREGLRETPVRVMKAWKEEWASGYHADPQSVLKTFEDGAANCDEMVLVRDLEFYSHCEHHMAPFFGKASIAYIPNGQKIVGLSKLGRLLDIFAKRLQVQERLTNQIADALVEGLEPLGVGVIIQARHMCMCSRGVQKQESTTITSALRGAMKDDARTRAEFLALAKP